MQQVVFVEEVSLVQVGTGRRPSTLPTVITHTTSVYTMGTGTSPSRTSTTSFTYVQCGLSTSETKCSGFNYLSILTRKKNQKFRPWLMWAKGFFYDIIVSWHYITIYQSLINNGFSPRIQIYSWSGLKAWLHNSCPIHLPCQQNKGQNSISWAVFGSFWNCKIWSALVCRPKTDYAETASRTFFKAGKHRQADYCMEKFRQ